MTLPTYDNTLIVDSLATVQSVLLGSVSDSNTSSWAPESPQYGLLAGEANMLRTFEIQRMILASSASPSKLLALPAQLIALGYAPSDARTIASSWVDARLEWYGVSRVQAQQAQWTIGVSIPVSAAPLTLTSSTTAVFTSQTGVVFILSISSPVTLTSGSLTANVTVTARNAGTSGNVVPGTITQCSGPVGLTVNTSASQSLLIAGREAQGDSQAIQTAQGRWAALGAGYSAKAFDYLIPTWCPTITQWSINDAAPLGVGTACVYLADAAGPATSSEVATVQAALNANQALCSNGVTAYAGTVASVPVTATIQSDGTNPNLLTQATAALASIQAAIPMKGAVLPISLIVAALQGGSIVNPTMLVNGVATVVDLFLQGFSGVVEVTLSAPSRDQTFAVGIIPVLATTLTLVVV